MPFGAPFAFRSHGAASRPGPSLPLCAPSPHGRLPRTGGEPSAGGAPRARGAPGPERLPVPGARGGGGRGGQFTVCVHFPAPEPGAPEASWGRRRHGRGWCPRGSPCCGAKARPPPPAPHPEGATENESPGGRRTSLGRPRLCPGRLGSRAAAWPRARTGHRPRVRPCRAALSRGRVQAHTRPLLSWGPDFIPFVASARGKEKGPSKSRRK